MAEWDFGGSFERGFNIGDRLAQRSRQRRIDEEAQERYDVAEERAASERGRANIERERKQRFETGGQSEADYFKRLEGEREQNGRYREAQIGRLGYHRPGPQDRTELTEAQELKALGEEDLMMKAMPEGEMQGEWDPFVSNARALSPQQIEDQKIRAERRRQILRLGDRLSDRNPRPQDASPPGKGIRTAAPPSWRKYQ